MKKLFLKIINFVKRSFPEPLFAILLLSLLVSLFWAISVAYNKKADTELKILEKEKIIAEYEKQANIREEECYKRCDEETNISRYGLSPRELCKLGCRSRVGYYDPTFQELKNIQKTPLVLLWLKHLLSNLFFYIPALLLLIIPLIRLLIIVIKSFKSFLPRAKKQISEMSVFQKYLMALMFCILLVLIFILIKLF